jgi:D-amino-acid dehydrogenase
LLDEGHEVLILDKEGPAFGPSRGNAGIIAHTDVLPIASPNMLRKVPGFLLDPLGPLAIRLGYLPQLLPWLARFLLAARPAAYERSIAGIIAIQQLALPAWLSRAEKAGLGGHIHRRGALYTYATRTTPPVSKRSPNASAPPASPSTCCSRRNCASWSRR